MTAPIQENQQQQDQKPNDKEYNFRQLEAKYQRQLEQERAARLEAEKKAQEAMTKKSLPVEDEDNYSEPYVDPNYLNKKMSAFERKLEARMEERIDKKAEEKARNLIDQQKRESWLKTNPDFYEVLQNADKFAQRDPDLAESILEMPDTFERQKLVYKNIKALGLHKPEQKQPSIQDKIDANRRSPYYQPSGVANTPYAGAGDFSPTGQKNAYDQMQKLKAQLRI